MFFGGLRNRGSDNAEKKPSRDEGNTTAPSDAPEKSPKRRRFFPRRLRGPKSVVDELATLRGHLGLDTEGERVSALHEPAPLTVHPTTRKSRTIIYSPDIDGPVDAGEIVWLFVPEHGPTEPPTERAVMVIGRSVNQDLLGLLISPNDVHDEDRDWFPIGSGPWQTTGDPCWVRLDRVIQVPEDSVRREGALLPERRFDRVARALRNRFGWT